MATCMDHQKRDKIISDEEQGPQSQVALPHTSFVTWASYPTTLQLRFFICSMGISLLRLLGGQS